MRHLHQVWWCTPSIPVLGKQRQADLWGSKPAWFTYWIPCQSGLYTEPVSITKHRYKKQFNGANVILQNLFTICVYINTQIWGSKCLSVLFWVKWVMWKTVWLSVLLKLLHRFTQKRGSLLHRGLCTSNCLTRVEGWVLEGDDSKSTAYCFSNSIPKWDWSYFPHVEWDHFLDLH